MFAAPIRSVIPSSSARAAVSEQRKAAADVTDEATLAVDFSDISKEFGGGGMEGMEMGYDGSRHCTAMGRLLPGQLTLDLRTADGSVYRL